MTALPIRRFFVAATVLVVGASIAFAAAPAPPKPGEAAPLKPGEPTKPPGPLDKADDDQKVKMQRRVVELDKSPVLIEAAKVRPVAPEILGRAIPATLGSYARGNVKTKINQVGPAMTAEATTVLTGPKGRTISVRITDSAGMPEGATGRPTQLEPGEKTGAGSTGREGFDLDGYRAVIESAGDISRLNVWITPRIHLALEGEKVGRDGLVAAAKAIDLKALAAVVK